MYPCLKVHYDRWYHYLRPKLLRAFPYMDNFTSIYDVLSRYFAHEDMRIAMTFQAKYLGMSPWTCPGAFTILSYVEHAFGVFHVRGGVHMLSEGMAKAAADLGAVIRLSSPIKHLIVEGGRARGVVLADGKEERADAVIMNADFANGMKELVSPRDRPKTTDTKIDSYGYSCSTYMLYLGIDGDTGHLPHHNIFFSGDYKKNIGQIFDGVLPEDPSFYVQNACVTDSSLAPKGKSALYVLVPVPNRTAPLDWAKESGPLRERILDAIEKRAGITNIRGRIEVERVVTPLDWERKASVYRGAVFNLAHTIGQMLYLRPHNRFDEIPGLYVAGGGTHPGSGLPTIVESGRIAADLISEDYQ
jgi:phytoene desaturase